MKSPQGCESCGTVDRELRPYGPGGSWTCLPCAKSTPEREAAAAAAYGALLDANAGISQTGAVVIGDASGPRPATADDLRSAGLETTP